MKSLMVLALSLFAASSAFAGKYSVNTSWEVLTKAFDVKIEAPTVKMGTQIGYMDVCLDGDMLRTINPVAITKTVHGKEKDTVVVIGHKYLSTSLNYKHTVSVCEYVGGHENQRYVCHDEVESGTYPTTVNVSVYSWKTQGEREVVNFLFKKPFTVQPCQ